MPVNEAHLRPLRESFARFGSGEFGSFFCPILQEPGVGTGLMHGHILNEAIKRASRTVVQRGDVDGHFGRTVEPEFLDVVNVRHETPAELARRHRRSMRAVGVDGAEFEIIHPSDRRQSPPFAKLVLTEAQKDQFGSPHVTIPPGRPADERYDVRIAFTCSDGAFAGSLLKSSYLALFHVFGYRFVFDPRLADVRSTLAAFVRSRATRAQANEYFARFRPAMNAIAGATASSLGDTIGGHRLLAHLRPGVGCFATSVLLSANRTTYAVTLPLTMDRTARAQADACYTEFLQGTATDREIWLVQYVPDKDEFIPCGQRIPIDDNGA